MSSDVVPNKKRDAYNCRSLFSKCLTCTLVTLRPIAMVALTLSISVIVYGPIHCALSLQDLPRRTVHQKANLNLLPAISSPLTSYHTVPCSYLYCRLGSCGRGDELSAIGFTVRNVIIIVILRFRWLLQSGR